MWKRMAKICWTERKSNEEVLTLVQERTRLVDAQGKAEMENGSVGHGSWVKWVTIFGWVT